MDPQGLPAFNRLVEDARAFTEGRMSATSTHQSLEVLDAALGALHGGFFGELEFREDSPLVEEVTGLLDQQFEMLRGLVFQASDAIRAEDAATLDAILAQARPSIDACLQALQRVRDEDAKRERFSESPYADELVRVGRLYLRGRLPVTAFQSRFEAFVDYHVNLVLALEALQPGRREQAAVQACAESLHQGVEAQAEGLELLRQFFEDGDERRITEGLDRVLRGSAALIAAQRAIQEASERVDTVPCLRCGNANIAGSRYCGKCNAPLLFVMSETVAEEPAVEFFEAEEEGAGPGFLPLTVQRLVDACDAAREGDASALLGEVEAMRRRVLHVRGRLGQLPDPPPETPTDQREAFLTALQGLDEGCRVMLEAVEILESFSQQPDPRLLDRGLEEVIAAAERISEPARIWEQIKQQP